jgi:hypothetical protein
MCGHEDDNKYRREDYLFLLFFFFHLDKERGEEEGEYKGI